MNFSEAKEYIINRLVKELPKNLFYHAAHHTFDVVKQAKTIGKSEGISNDEMFILLTAAYFHDAGFLFKYQSNESEAVKLVREVLPEMDYTQEEIEEICKIHIDAVTKVKNNCNKTYMKLVDLYKMYKCNFVLNSHRSLSYIERNDGYKLVRVQLESELPSELDIQKMYNFYNSTQIVVLNNYNNNSCYFIINHNF